MKRIRVLLAEDHTIVREGLRALLEAEGDIEILCEARTGREAVKLATEHRPDVILLDIAMPELNGLQAARQIFRTLPGSRILILSAHEDDAYLEHALGSGVAGYLIKQTSSHMLASAVRAVAAGEMYFCASVRKRLPQYEAASKGMERRKRVASKLTERENEVLQLIAEGHANKQVAADLEISIKTVEKHRQSLKKKLGIQDTAGLTRYAIESGIIDSSNRRATGEMARSN